MSGCTRTTLTGSACVPTRCCWQAWVTHWTPLVMVIRDCSYSPWTRNSQWHGSRASHAKSLSLYTAWPLLPIEWFSKPRLSCTWNLPKPGSNLCLHWTGGSWPVWASRKPPHNCKMSRTFNETVVFCLSFCMCVIFFHFRSCCHNSVLLIYLSATGVSQVVLIVKVQ